MAQEIFESSSASEMFATINSNFGNGSGIQVILGTETANEFVQKLNANFDAVEHGGSGTFPAHTVLAQDVGDFKAGEDLGGLSLDEFIRYGINGESRTKVRFLHISDTHNIGNSVSKCKSLMDDDSDIDFTLHTGDVIPSGTTYDNIKSKLLIINGNHDIYDVYNKSQAAAVTWLRSHCLLPNVAWGDDVEINGSTSQSGYWYKDFTISANSKLRIIALDQYELDRVANTPQALYVKAYSQAQLEWVAAKMRDLGADDYLVMVTHEPMVSLRSDSITGFALTEDTPDKLFVSDKLITDNRSYWSNIGNQPVEQLLVSAYMKGSTLAAQASAIAGVSSLSYLGSSIDMTKSVFDFSGVTPATFLFHACGHMHADITTYLNECPDQLMLLIDGALTNKDNGSDLTRSGDNLINGTWYCINDVTIDFSTKRIVIKRIGGQTTDANGRLASSRTRDAIYFPFVKPTN